MHSQVVKSKLTKEELVHLLHSMWHVFSRFGAVCDVSFICWEVLHLGNTVCGVVKIAKSTVRCCSISVSNVPEVLSESALHTNHVKQTGDRSDCFEFWGTERTDRRVVEIQHILWTKSSLSDSQLHSITIIILWSLQLSQTRDFTSCLGTKCSPQIGAVSHTYITEIHLDFRPTKEVEVGSICCFTS